MHVGDAAVTDPHLVAVDDPVVAVAACPGAQITYVTATFGLGNRQCGEFEIAWGAKTFGCPLQHLLRGSGLTDRRERQCRHHYRQTDYGTTPDKLFHEHRQGQDGGNGDESAV